MVDTSTAISLVLGEINIASGTKREPKIYGKQHFFNSETLKSRTRKNGLYYYVYSTL